MISSVFESILKEGVMDSCSGFFLLFFFFFFFLYTGIILVIASCPEANSRFVTIAVASALKSPNPYPTLLIKRRMRSV